MMLLAGYNNLQNIVSKIYEEYGFRNMGQTALMIYYATAGVASFISSYIVKAFGHQKSMLLSGIAFSVCEASSFFIITEMPIANWMKWVCVIVGACIGGVGSSVLWISQGSYIS